MSADPPSPISDPSASPEAEAVEVAWGDREAARLRDAFDAEMAERYGDDAPSTQTAALRLEGVFAIDHERFVACLLVRIGGVAAAHGALFERADLGPGTFEVRKVVVDPAFRGRRLGHRVMAALEAAAAARDGVRLVLDTGPRQPDAIALYTSRGFTRIPSFEPYTALPTAMCFAKRLA